MVQRVFQKMETDYLSDRAGSDSAVPPKLIFEVLLDCVLKTNEEGYKELGLRIGKTEGAVKQEVRRLRFKFKNVFREEVSQTLSNPSDFDDEIRFLLGVLQA
jgi:hypothetical protein